MQAKARAQLSPYAYMHVRKYNHTYIYTPYTVVDPEKEGRGGPTRLKDSDYSA